MATKRSMWVLFGILVITAWVLGPAIQAGAENMNFKLYTYVMKAERIPVEDVEGHFVRLIVRGAFYAFENGEVATVSSVSTEGLINLSGPFTIYSTVTFADGSTIILKGQGTAGGRAGGWTSEIIKGTGRFAGIKGTLTSKAKYLPTEKGEPGARGYGEGTITYTLPSK